jgi:hypothetical protein
MFSSRFRFHFPDISGQRLGARHGGRGMDVTIGGSVDELGGNAHVLPRPHDRSFHDAIDVQFPRDLWQCFLAPFVTHHRGSGDHTEGADFSEVSSQLIGHTINKNSCDGSPEELSSGSTAMERTGRPALARLWRCAVPRDRVSAGLNPRVG